MDEEKEKHKKLTIGSDTWSYDEVRLMKAELDNTNGVANYNMVFQFTIYTPLGYDDCIKEKTFYDMDKEEWIRICKKFGVLQK